MTVAAVAERGPSPAGMAPENLAVLRRLRNDFSYWARKCFFIQTQDFRLAPLVARPAQARVRAIEDEEQAKCGMVRLYLLKARRAGFSTDQQARAFHLVWSRPRTTAMTLAHTDVATGELFEITRRARENFPPGLLGQTGRKDTYELEFPLRDSRFYTRTAGSRGPGRGATLTRAHCSEFAHWHDPIGALSALLPAMEGVPGSAMVLETTAGGYGSKAHEFWRGAADGRNGFRAIFFPWWECDPVAYRLPLDAPDELGRLDEEEAGLVVRHGLSLEQIKWRRSRIATIGRDFFLQENAEDENSCWLTVGGLYYGAELLKAVEGLAPSPLRVEDDGVAVYHEPSATERLVLGADTAEGIGGDRSAFVVRSFPSWRLLATYADHRIAPKEFTELVNKWGRKWTPRQPALLIVEKNAHGITVLRELRDTHKYPTANIYHRTPLDKQRDERTERIGWATTAETVPLMLAAGHELLHAAKAGRAEAPCAAGIRDAFGIVRGDDGRVSMTGRDIWVAETLAWIGRGVPQEKPGAVRVQLGY